MRFFPAEPDIATIFNRIKDSDIDLQPDFQRGEVWPVAKQQRLVDSILRGWVIPPILLIAGKAGRPQQVLDGQQRLAAIRDFKLNKFSVDGKIEPSNSLITSLDGQRFHSLPSDVAKSFDRTTLRIYEIDDYLPAEPAEIFFRLNQPTVLTSAEKRNAFFGPVRDHIRQLVDKLKQIDSIGNVLGFSNTRMAYDDVLARFACVLEFRTLRKKVTAGSVNDMYRRLSPLNAEIEMRLDHSIQIFSQMILGAVEKNDTKMRPRLNKATFFSWLLFAARLAATGDLPRVSAFFYHFESVRAGVVSENEPLSAVGAFLKNGISDPMVSLLHVYTDRATARVADISSVLLRDFILWLSWYDFTRGVNAPSKDPAFSRLGEFHRAWKVADSTSQKSQLDAIALKFIDEIDWGLVV